MAGTHAETDRVAGLLLAVIERTTGETSAEATIRDVAGIVAHHTGWGPIEVLPGDTPPAPGRLAFPVAVGGETVAQLTCERPVTPSPELRGAVEAVCAHLGDVVARRRQLDELERVRIELERSNADLEQFAAVASHDLQEPLRKVIGYCELLRDRYRGALDDDADLYIGYAVDGAHRMRELIQDLLTYARIGRGGTEIGDVDLDAVMRAVVAELDPEAGRGGEAIRWEDLPTIGADRRQITLLLTNLLSNALKFRGEAPADVTVTAEATDDGRWAIHVRDEGIGIAPADHDRIFELFRRLHRREVIPGTGIGLAISARIAANHGARISVDSEPGAGTTFHVATTGGPQ